MPRVLCPKCSSSVNDWLAVCPACGFGIAAARAGFEYQPQTAETLLRAGRLKPCKECGHDVSVSARTCPKCGKPYPTGGLTLPAKVFLAMLGLFVIGQVLSSTSSKSRDRASVRQAGSRTNERLALSVSAERLFDDYQANEVAADNIYKGRPLIVTGVIDGIRKDFMDNTYVTLTTANPFMSVHANLRPTEVSAVTSLAKGMGVRLICVGSGMIVGSPMLKNCVLQ